MQEIQSGHSTLIICPKNLVPMWEDHVHRYGVHAKIVPFSMVHKELANVPGRFRIVLIDESHNLRNRGRRFHAIRDYVQQTTSRVILLSATPYNKTFGDLANQLRLFLNPEEKIPVRPEVLLREIGEVEFGKLQVSPHSLAAFENSPHADDWRELMRFFLVRRTRTFIQDNYAFADCACGQAIKADEDKCPQCGKSKPVAARRYLRFADGSKSYFPTRVPKTLRFPINEADPNDQYARLYSAAVVDSVNQLSLPRYGLGNYVDERPDRPPTAAEGRIIADLARAGRRLMGFCRTNLFKRLESSGFAFLQSLERHILRNYIYLHAVQNGLPVPIGPQDAALLDEQFTDADANLFEDDEDDGEGDAQPDAEAPHMLNEAQYRARAAEIYKQFAGPHRKRFRWLDAGWFKPELPIDLRNDALALLEILRSNGAWDPQRDAKLNLLEELIRNKHSGRKVLVFSQFADTVEYLVEQLNLRKLKQVAGATGNSENPTRLAWRFSPRSNKRNDVTADQELQVLVATDVLSEGQNLQDAAVVVNYDLPWAIIRLIQRAGRVDRIGQKAEEISCYTFFPADGVERIIRLHARVRQRLRDNGEVVGSDEAFFDEERFDHVIRDLFTEKSGALDDPDREVDADSYAYEIWRKALQKNSNLEEIIKKLDDVVYSTKSFEVTDSRPDGVLAFVRNADGLNALAWVDRQGNAVTQSTKTILDAAACDENTPTEPRLDNHHELVGKAVDWIAREQASAAGNLGSPSGARFRAYHRLKQFIDEVKDTLLDQPDLRKALQDLNDRPLREVAITALNQHLRAGIADAEFAELVLQLRKESKLTLDPDQEETRRKPGIICTMGLRK